MITRTATLLTLALATTHAAHAQQLQLWAEGLSKPVDLVQHPTDDHRWYAVEQAGLIRVIENGELLDEPFFEVNRDNFTDRNWEQGLLGMAFDPGFEENAFFYLNYTGRGGTTHISRFRAEDPHHAPADSEQVILTFEQPYGNHNGGCLRFGPDGMLYIGTGDGGAANDPHDYGQRLDTLLGKMLRIDVTSEPDEGLAYAIPSDNPWADDDDVPGEIWAYGLRNPWRYSFDSRGRLWIADVGQNRFEWVHLQPADSEGGENYGWKILEGDRVFRPGGRRADDPPQLDPDQIREKGIVPPVWSYVHHPTASITGGYVYEGERVRNLRGRYICADFMSGRFWSFILGAGGRADDIVEHTRDFTPAFGRAGPQQAVSSFARARDGELYVLDHKEGRVFRIVP